MTTETYPNIKTVIGESPRDYDLAIVSVGRNAGKGYLSEYVLSELNYDISVLDSVDVKEGFYTLFGQKVPVLFIVTVSNEKTETLLRRNLSEAFKKLGKQFENKNVWVPLMGTGVGGLNFEDSYSITVEILKSYSNIEFSISIPDDARGKDFLKRFKTNDSKIESKKRVKDIIVDLSSLNVFIVGAYWDGNDQAERFIKDSIWENGYSNRYLDEVASVRPGDLLLLKSTFAKKGDSILRVKAFGYVIYNDVGENRLFVQWTSLGRGVDISGYGYYRETIDEASFEDKQTIVNTLLEKTSAFSVETIEKSKLFRYDTFFEEIYDVKRLVKDVINKEYNIDLSIQKKTEGAFLFDLTDEANDVYINLFHKKDYDSVADVYLLGKLVNDFKKYNSLLENTHYNFHFAFLDDSFTKEDILKISSFGIFTGDTYDSELNPFAIRRGKNKRILPLRHILHLAGKQGIKFSDYLHQTEVTEEATGKDSDKIPFHLDNVETVDRLNREPVAKSLARLINNEIFSNEELNHSFMIHLQGEWGSGKSTFLNLLEKNLNTPQKKWVIIKYNAWQNQHISPPWWSFIDQIYQQTKPKLQRWKERFGLKRQENKRRIIWYSGWHKIMTLVISFIFIGLLIAYGKSLFTAIAETPATENIETTTKGLTVNIFAKLIVSIGSVIGLIYSLSKFLSTPFTMKSSGEAKSFMLRASDPMNRIKTHFNDLVSDINKKGYELAVFVDDIDRCNKAYTVNLLEGIQTLFKDKKVLYVVAGDKNWISTCFENNYGEFVDRITRNNEQLGDLFLEKAFQLSVRMPNVSERTKEKYWHHILGIDEVALAKEALSDTEKVALKQDIAREIRSGGAVNPELLKNLEEAYNASEEVVSDAAIEMLDDEQEDIKHLFMDHFRLINPNPRAIKRLANNYTMYRNTLVAERKDFDANKLFRWLIIDNMYPIFSRKLVRFTTDEEINTHIEKMNLSSTATRNLKMLVYDEDQTYGGKIESTDIKDILGI